MNYGGPKSASGEVRPQWPIPNTNKRTAPACQATLSPDSKLVRVRQVDEERVFPMTGADEGSTPRPLATP